MPAFILSGAITVNTPQQNGAVFVGQNSVGGWDANMKFNTAHGGNFGVFSVQMSALNVMLDNLEVIDGMINDQDLKISPTLEI
ncbi:hypothetical protein [Alicyclobacillus ferrooxydans]|uniref:Uncharacterized protein n=1 Tax=Alicyclobacillus ferrooxydans TaxID=471514 RepID=A0A0P9CC92_9BACL|nr:hypothetical protein [Alicyclobacillus ferrooxydans]KPV43088.1 hypothetical protein AN477_14235 [Alicyclobacillus ferrooxydans]